MAPPEGLLLGPPSKPWRVGRELGRGACGSVHLIERHGGGGSGSGGSSGRGTSSSPSGGTSYVAKVAPIPASSSSSSSSTSKGGKTKKKKKTALERNADLLYHENTLYRNVLNDMRGTMVPEVPHPGEGGPPGYGDVDGYRFFCMERMDGPLSTVVPALLAEARRGGAGTRRSRGSSRSSSAGSTAIPLGDVAATLVGMVEALHAKRLLFVDVKAENFMLAPPPSGGAGRGGSKKGSSSTSAELSDRIRMIDFGLAESFRDVTSGGHREDMYPDAQVVGTPEYASLNVLGGHTPSRRDDLEAVGYVLAELVLEAVESGADGSVGSGSSSGGRTKSGKRASASTTTSGTFPWSKCKSDEEVLRVKTVEVEGGKRGGSFFARMGAGGNSDAEKVMRKYFGAVRNLGYSEKPDYEKLKKIVGALMVVVDAGGAAADGEGEKKPAAASRTKKRQTRPEKEHDEDVVGATGGRKRATRSSAASRSRVRSAANVDSEEEAEFDEDVAPMDSISKKARGSSARTGARANLGKGQGGEEDAEMQEFVEIDDDEDNDFHTCSSGQMDWELVPDENEAPPTAAASTRMAEASGGFSNRGALQILVIDGPHKGESFGIGGEAANVITVGRGPAKPRSGASSSSGVYKLGKDNEASTSHAKLALYSAKGGSHSIRVTDLKATNGTFVNGKAVPKGKYKQAFIGDKIQVGGSTLQVKRPS